MTLLLAGDIGGTHTRLGLFDPAGDWTPTVERVYPSREHRSLDEIVRAFVAEVGQRPSHACFAVAGPVRDERAVVTNLPWVVDGAALTRFLGATSWVINDLEANAWGVATLLPAHVAELQAGAPHAHGNAAVVAAGTGLGTAGLFWDGHQHRPFAAEGGHATFSPCDERERALAAWLERRLGGHVSWERVVSGPGLVNVYEFLRDEGVAAEEPSLADAMRSGDPGAAISSAALDGASDLARQALDLFVALYASVAGNVALTVLSSAGVWLGGGIAPRIVAKLADGTFARRFVAKGRMQPLLEAMPVRVILNDQAALRGAARCASVRAAG
jgi:glucokinase